jgi:hypothetical protein
MQQADALGGVKPTYVVDQRNIKKRGKVNILE